MTRATGLILATLLLTGLTACAPEPVNEPAPAVEPTQTVKPTPAPEATPDQAVLPGCQEIIADEMVAEVVSPYHEPLTGEAAVRLQGLHRDSLGPVARDALAQASDVQQCTWAIPQSDGIEHVLIALLPEPVWAHFVTELRASVYSESTNGDLLEFTYQEETIEVWYGFYGDLWIATGGEGHGQTIGDAALESFRAINPSSSG